MPSIKHTALAALIAVTANAAPTQESALLDTRGNTPRSFHIPEGQADGIYSVAMDQDGNHVHTKVSSLHEPPQEWRDHWRNKGPRDVPTLEARDEKNGVNCNSNGAIMDDSEVSRAAYNLGSSCDNGGPQFVQARSSQYALSGNAVVFTCNHSYNGWYSAARACSTTEVMQNIELIEKPAQCNHKEGWNAHVDSKASYSFGYIRVGSGFC